MFLKHLFTRRKISFFIFPLFLISLIFIIYQVVMFVQISNETKEQIKNILIRGIHEQENRFYIPNSENKFTCIRSLEVIDFYKINDNYCDCLDGSDEPGTSACPNGLFFCGKQIDIKNFRKAVPSSKVNDGICDCCDGSDEWENNKLLNMDNNYVVSTSCIRYIPEKGFPLSCSMSKDVLKATVNKLLQ